MDLLKRRTTCSNSALSIVKIGVLTTGIIAGYYARDYLTGYLNLLWFISTISCLIALYLWAVKSKRR